MKSIFYQIIFAFLFLSLNSCEENFSPKTDYKEKYVLYSIINIDSSVQTAVLQKSYNVEGLDPYQNTKATFIQGADIRIRQKDNVFFMRDTSIIRTDTSRYNSLIDFYYTNNFFLQGNDSLEILVTMSDGRKLYAKSALASKITFDKVSDKILPPEDKDHLSFIWQGPVSSRWYLPKLTFYFIKDGVRYSKDVPVEYKIESGEWIAVYPQIINSNAIRFNKSALDSAFVQISQGDPNKNDYKILGAVLTLLIFDEAISNYYSSTNGFLDDFTVRIDEKDYTNIQGGLGIFGTYRKQITGATFTHEYIKSFGYTPGLD